MLVNEEVITGANEARGGFTTESDVRVACRFESGISIPNMVKVVPNTPDFVIDSRNIQNSFVQPNFEQFTYTLNRSDKQGTVTFRCIDKATARCPDYSQVTVSFISQSPEPGPTITGCSPGGSTDKPSASSTSKHILK